MNELPLHFCLTPWPTYLLFFSPQEINPALLLHHFCQAFYPLWSYPTKDVLEAAWCCYYRCYYFHCGVNFNIFIVLTFIYTCLVPKMNTANNNDWSDVLILVIIWTEQQKKHSIQYLTVLHQKMFTFLKHKPANVKYFVFQQMNLLLNWLFFCQ